MGIESIKSTFSTIGQQVTNTVKDTDTKATQENCCEGILKPEDYKPIDDEQYDSYDPIKETGNLAFVGQGYIKINDVDRQKLIDFLNHPIKGFIEFYHEHPDALYT